MIVYVGAVAVLFLFVVMMLDIDFAELRAGFIKNFPLGIAIALVLLAELVLGIGAYRAGALELGVADGSAAPIVDRSNIENLGQCFTASTCSCSRSRASSCWWRWSARSC